VEYGKGDRERLIYGRRGICDASRELWGLKNAWPRPPSTDIEQFQRVPAVETSGQILILDLKDVTLVNLDAVKFLLHCEVDGIQLEN
jgi:hypothetical protein